MTDGWHFTDEQGQVRSRQRNPDPMLYDLDYMPRAELEKLVAVSSSMTRTAFGRLLFPSRPLHFPLAAMRLVTMARLKLDATVKNRWRFERLYRLLPRYAQYRQQFNVQAAVLPGQKFRKHPPRRRAK